MSVLFARHGVDHILQVMEGSMQAGLFGEFMTGIYLTHVQKVKVCSPSGALEGGGRSLRLLLYL